MRLLFAPQHDCNKDFCRGTLDKYFLEKVRTMDSDFLPDSMPFLDKYGIQAAEDTF